MQTITRRYIIAAFILLLGGGGVLAVRQLRPGESYCAPDLYALPKQIGAYTAHEISVEEWIFKFLEADAMRDVLYEANNSSELPVHLSAVYSKHWRSIHAPIHCYPAQGWLIISQVVGTVNIGQPLSHGRTVQVNRLHVSKGGEEMILLYVMSYMGGTTANWAKMAYEVATGPRGGGGLIITLSAPLSKSSPAKTDEALETVLRQVYPTLINSWY